MTTIKESTEHIIAKVLYREKSLILVSTDKSITILTIQFSFYINIGFRIKTFYFFT